MAEYNEVLKKFPVHLRNPFIKNFKKVTKLLFDKWKPLDDNDQLEYRKAAGSKVILVNKHPAHIKVYGLFKIVRNLNKAGLDLLCYIADHLVYNKDTILLYPSNVMIGMGKKRTSFYRGVIELLEYGVIARKEGTPHEFYINHNLLFKGDETEVFRNDELL